MARSPPPPPAAPVDPAPERDATVGHADTLISPVARSAPEGGPPVLTGGRYVVEDRQGAELLGRGGQGEVWRARDVLLRREVALKRVHPAFAGDPEVVAAFLREARLTARLEHPGIVPLHDLGTDAEGRHFIVLRLVEGRSLADRLTECADLDARLRLVPALLRACQAVAFAHQRGVVHRDLKPQNVMLGPLGETYVLDWGLALLGEAAGPAGAEVTAPQTRGGVVGTPAYMSPEQALGFEADARTDVWGLGACLYHLLTGRPPITGGSVDSAVRHAAAEAVTPVAEREPGVPADLAAICEKALATERARRYPDAGALARDLEAWIAGRTVSAREYSWGELALRTVRAHKALVAVSALALATIAGVVVANEVRLRRERDEAHRIVRELVFDLPGRLETTRGNVAAMNFLVSRAQQWLARSDDLDEEEVREGCFLLSRLGDYSLEVGQTREAQDLYERAIALATRGRAQARDVGSLEACRAEGLLGQGVLLLQVGDQAAGEARVREALAVVEGWAGPPHPQVTLARATILYQLGTQLWEADFDAASRQVLEASALSRSMLRSGDTRSRRRALDLSINAVAATWYRAGRRAAIELSREMLEAAAPECTAGTLDGDRVCMQVLAAWASIAAWEAPAVAQDSTQRALTLDETMVARDGDSASTLYNSLLLSLELGDLHRGATRARAMRERHGALFGAELPLLVTALAGDGAEFEAWRRFEEPCGRVCALALGLVALARDERAEAARQLRVAAAGRLWSDLSWPAHPAPGFTVAAALQPAFEAFLRDFSRATGDVDEPGMARALEALAAAVEGR